MSLYNHLGVQVQFRILRHLSEFWARHDRSHLANGQDPFLSLPHPGSLLPTPVDPQPTFPSSYTTPHSSPFGHSSGMHSALPACTGPESRLGDFGEGIPLRSGVPGPEWTLGGQPISSADTAQWEGAQPGEGQTLPSINSRNKSRGFLAQGNTD